MPHLSESSASPPSSPELFVYLSWRTQGGEPLLADDQIRQAVCQAVSARTRLQFCHLLAFLATDRAAYNVFQFPASLPVSQLARISMQAAEEAVTHLHGILYASPCRPAPVWERDYVLRTLSAEEASKAKDYLRRQIPDSETDSARRVV